MGISERDLDDFKDVASCKGHSIWFVSWFRQCPCSHADPVERNLLFLAGFYGVSVWQTGVA